MYKIITVFFTYLLLSSCATNKNGFHINPDANTLSLEIKKDRENSSSSNNQLYQIAKDWIGTLIALVSLIYGFKILRKKLLEQHITKALSDIQDTNKRILIESTRLIDEYIPRTYSSEPIKLEELKDVLEHIKKLYYDSQGGSTECQTLLYYLKTTLQHTYKHYGTDEKHLEIIISIELYKLVIDTLQWVNFYSTQVVYVPKSGKTEDIYLFKKEVSKNLTDSKFTKYRHFKQGFTNDPNSALYLAFMIDIHTCRNTLIKRSAFQIYQNNEVLGSLLQTLKMYAPLKLDLYPSGERTNSELFLIGYSVYSFQGGRKDLIKLLYTNPSENHVLIPRLIGNEEIQNLKDTFIVDSGFDITRQTSTPKYQHLETVLIEFDTNYLKEQFEKNGKELKRKLKKQPSYISRLSKSIKGLFK